MRKNPCVTAVLSELESVGLRGEVVQRTKHIEVRWFYNGHTRAVFTSATPSDHRAPLNIKMETRRILRKDGIDGPIPEQRLQKALQLPPPRRDQGDRLQRVEAELTVLIDLVLELHDRLSTPTVTVDFGKSPLVEKIRGGVSAKVLAAMSTTWKSRQDIARQAGIPADRTSAILTYLSKKKLVENGLRGEWRRKA